MSYPKRFERPSPGFVVWSRTIDQIVATGVETVVDLESVREKRQKAQ
jgi:hypothetical protein